jgi:hypothetical protein
VVAKKWLRIDQAGVANISCLTAVIYKMFLYEIKKNEFCFLDSNSIVILGDTANNTLSTT